MAQDGGHGAIAAEQCSLVVIAGVPLGDIGGGQRSAQLSRAAARLHCNQSYFYMFPSMTAEGVQYVPGADGLRQELLSSESFESVLAKHTAEGRSPPVVVIEVPHPDALVVLEPCRRAGVRLVLELLDDWTDSELGGTWFDWGVFEQMAAASSLIVCTAQSLCDQMGHISSKPGMADVLYLPNAADELRFQPWTPEGYVRPAEMQNPSQRYALYFGSLLGTWVRWDWILAAAGACAETQFIIIGGVWPHHLNMTSSYPNIVLAGMRKHAELATYLQASTINLLPFSRGPLLETISPIKIFEYGFAGRPVAGAFSYELNGAAYPFMWQASSKADFAKLACGYGGAVDPTPEDNADFIMQHSWGYALDRMLARPVLHTPVIVLFLPFGEARGLVRAVRSTALSLGMVTAMPNIIIAGQGGEGIDWDDLGAELAESAPRAEGIFDLMIKRPAAAERAGCSAGGGCEASKPSSSEASGALARCNALRREARSLLRSVPDHAVVAVLHHSAVVASSGWLHVGLRLMAKSPRSVVRHRFSEHGVTKGDWIPGRLCDGAQLCMLPAGLLKSGREAVPAVELATEPPGIIWGPMWKQPESLCGL